MLAIILFGLAALAPVFAALGLVLWRRFICHDEAAAALAGGVALGLLAGVVMGCAVTGLLIGLVKLIAHATH